MYAILKVRSYRNDNKSLYQWHLDENNDVFLTDNLDILANEVEIVANSTPLDYIKVISTVDFELDTLIDDSSISGNGSMTKEEFDKLYNDILSDLKEGE